MIDHDELPETEAPADRWSALLPAQELIPAYLASRFAAQYRVIVDVLPAERDMSLTGLSYDEVAAGWYHADRLSGSSFAIMRNREQKVHTSQRGVMVVGSLCGRFVGAYSRYSQLGCADPDR
ncbi:DUF2397 domain-containing protein [Amycolatopsis sp. GM8]|uniref:DUF2397 domain-containing protein n=1 Tax=Amycolatopsis sp. GM8 TaxID=2896530 RepID=UPI001F3C9F17|nr:DUF2397 domain-containing protein [Amycolatopsis sp. GM8]